MKHDNLWDFLWVKPGEVDQRNDHATVNFDNFCAIRSLQSVRLEAPPTDPWSVCGVKFHAYERIPLVAPLDTSSAIAPLAASDSCTNGNYNAIWESGPTARTTSTTTGTYTYTINQSIDACTGNSCVNARQGFALTLDERVKACLAGTNPIDTSCNGIDEDCDGFVDDNWQRASAVNCIGECQLGATCTAGAVVCGAPATEIPGNGKNEDCDARTDELPPLASCTGDVQCDASDVCQGGKCVAPYCSNGVQDVGNGETGIDCGGTNCPACDGLSGCPLACRLGQPTIPDSQAVLRFSAGAFRRDSNGTYEPQHGRIASAALHTLRWIDVSGKRMALLEGESTNTALQSQSFDSRPWSVPSGSRAVVQPNAMIAPDGTASADVITMGQTVARGPMYGRTFTGRSAVSVYAAVAPGSTVSRRATRAFAVDASNARVASGEWSLDETWQRVAFGVESAVANGALAFSHAPRWPDDETEGLPTANVGLWGAQVEALPFPSSYIPASAGNANRSADILTFSAVPSWVSGGLWQMEVMPEFSSAELVPNWNHTLVSASAGRVGFVDAGDGAAYLQSNFAGQHRSAALRWDRGAILRLTFDTALDRITIEGATGGPVTMAAPGMTFTGRVRIGGLLDGRSEAFAAFTEPRAITSSIATCTQDASCTCGNGTRDAGEECDPVLTANCTGACTIDEPHAWCDSDLDCVNGHSCVPGMAASFDLPADWKICVPNLCSLGASESCGSLTAPCGRCECTPQCDDKHCGDDPDDGCGGTCSGLCAPLEVGCVENTDCRGGDFCWIGQAWRFDPSAPPDANVCAPAECSDIDPRRLDCGDLSSPCGRCDPSVPPCLRGALCRKDTAPSCPEGEVMNQVGACVPTYGLPTLDNAATAAIGALPGSFAVSSAGNSQYRIPFAVPPGRAGLEPKLTLTYDSSRGNSMVGLGWALEGLSQINVCPKSVAQDGYVDGTVALCVDGARLVPVSYDPATNTTEWRTEFETFTKYETAGDFHSWDTASPTDIKSFKATTKDGLVLTYGISEPLLANGEDDPARLRTQEKLRLEGQRFLTYSAWALGSVRDRAGNELRFRYSKLTWDGPGSSQEDVELLPRWIGYNFVGNPNDDKAAAEVVFEYGDESLCPQGSPIDDCPWKRTDPLEGYMLGQKRAYTRMLSAVRMYALGQEVRNYRLTPIELRGGVRTTKQVTECVKGNVCRPATEFDYLPETEQPAYDLHPLFGLSIGGARRDFNRMVLDYNGDASPDVAIFVSYGANQGISIYSFTARDTGVSPGLPSYSFSLQGNQRPKERGRRYARDMNRDGAQDIVYEDMEGRLRVLTRHDSSMSLPLKYLNSDGEEEEYTIGDGQFMLADLNGDRLPDVVICGINTALVHLNLGETLSVAKPMDGGGDPELAIAGNCAGAQIVNDSNNREHILWTSRKTGRYELFGEMYDGHYGTTELFVGDRAQKGIFFTLDFNGDGLIDIANATELSTGTHTTTFLTYWPNLGNLKFGRSFSVEQPGGAEGMTHADIDGDGRDERIQVRDHRIEILAVDEQTGRKLPGDVDWFYIADMDFDGTKDIVAKRRGWNDDWVVYPGASAFEGLLEKVTVPFSSACVPNTYDIDYSMSNDVFRPGAANLLDGVAPQRRLFHPVVATYTAEKYWQKSGLPERVEYRSESFKYARGLRDRQTGTWLGFAERTVERVGFGGVGEATSTYTFKPRVVEEPDAGPFYARDPNLRGRGYVYRYFPYVGAAPESESHSMVVNGYGNPLTGGLDTERVNRTERSYEVLRSDKGLAFVNVESEVHSTSENGTLLERVSFATQRDTYGNVKVSTETHGDGRFARSVLKYEHESDASRTPKWQVGLLDERTDTVSESDGTIVATHVERYDYKPDGYLHTVTSEPGRADAETITTFSREDAWKNLTHVEIKPGLVSRPEDAPAPRSTSLVYDELGVHVYSTQNDAMHVSTFETGMGDGLPRYHRDLNQVVTRWKYDGFGRLKEQNRETEQIVTTYDYSRAGQVSSPLIVINGAWKVDATTTSVAANESFTHTSVYDPEGLLVRQISPGYEAGTTVSREYNYTRGLLTKATRLHLEGHTSQGFASFEYDNLGRRDTEYLPGYRKRTIWYASSATVGKDFKGTRKDMRWVARVDSPKETSSFYYNDANGNLVEAVEGATSTTYTYDAAGFLREVKDPVGNLTTRTPDALGRLANMVDPDTGRESYTYNSFGEIKTVKHNDQTHTYRYDTVGRMVELASSDGVIRNTYDSIVDPLTGEERARAGALMRSVTQAVAGQTEEQSPGGGHIDDYYYDDDAIGQLRTIRRSVLLSSAGNQPEREEMDLGLEYDAWHRANVIHYPGAAEFSVKYEYDAKGFLLSARNALDPAEEFYKLQEVFQGYRPKKTRLAGTMTQDFTFSDSEGWVEDAKTTVGRFFVEVVHFGYDYDRNGNMRHVRRFHDAQETEAKFYHYDGLERLRSVTRGEAGPELEGFTYTKTGNLKTKSGAGTYVYGTLDQDDEGVQTLPHFVRTVVNGGIEVASFTPDAWGRVRSRAGIGVPGGSQTFSYDAFGRLKSVRTGPSSDLTEFEYGAGGDRVLRREHGGDILTSYFSSLYEHRRGEQERDVETFRIMVNGQAIAERSVDADGTTMRYLHRNHLGSVEVVTDERGVTQERRDYTAYGEQVSPVEEDESVLSFTGHRGESELGLVDMLGRFYDPKFGRFLTPDPIVAMPWSGQSLNRYSYVLNNPATLVDPTGFLPDQNPYTGESQDPGTGPGFDGGHIDGMPDGDPEGRPDTDWQWLCDNGLGCAEGYSPTQPTVQKPSVITPSPSLRGSPVSTIDGPLEGSGTHPSAWERGDYQEVVFNAADSGATALAGLVDGMLWGAGDTLRGWAGYEGLVNTDSAEYKTGEYGSYVVGAAGLVKGGVAALRAGASRWGKGIWAGVKRLARDERGSLFPRTIASVSPTVAELRELGSVLGFQVHHILPQYLGKMLGYTVDQMLHHPGTFISQWMHTGALNPNALHKAIARYLPPMINGQKASYTAAQIRAGLQSAYNSIGRSDLFDAINHLIP